MGGHVYKGEKSTPIVYWDVMEKEDREKPRETKKIPFLRYHSVFNLDQTSITVEPPVSQVDGEKLEKARLIVANFQ